MPQLHSVSQLEAGESFGCSIFVACLGLFFAVIGIYTMTIPPDQYTGGTVGSLIALAFGSLFVWGGVHQAWLSLKFGKPDASISEAVIKPGEKFHFRYRQECRQFITIKSIGVFLVFRERVTYDDGGDSTTNDLDRLMQQHTVQGRVCSAGEVIQQQHIFEIPARTMGIRNSFMNHKNVKVETMWVVKVRIELGKNNDVWKEYEVEVNGNPVEDRSSDSLKRQDNLFDLFLVESVFMSPLHMVKVMSPLLPHLRQGQIADLHCASPSLLLERVTENEAQTAKAQLEAAGAKVEIKPSVDE
jgi:hypothetical protein